MEQEAAKSGNEGGLSDEDDETPRPRGKGKGKGKHSDDDDYFGSLDQVAEPRRRRNSDPSSDRALVSRRRQKDDESEDSRPEEDVIEVLPDRFDSQGRPLDGSGSRSRAQLHARQGDFEYRSPRGPGGFNMQGHWGVAGTDPEAVERIVRDVTGVLEGRGSWLGLLGTVLGGGLLQGTEGQEAAEEKVKSRRSRAERAEAGSGRRRRSMGDHDRYDVDDEYFYDEDRKRRHMTHGGRRRQWNDGD